MKIGKKLVLGFSIVVVLTLILGTVSILNIKDIGTEAETYYKSLMPMGTIITRLRINVEEVVRTTEEYDADWMAKEEASKEIEETKEQIETSLERLFPAQDLITLEEVNRIKGLVNELYDLSANIFSLHGKSRAERTPAMGGFDEKVAEIDKELDMVLNRIDEASKTSADSITNTIASSSSIDVLVLIVVILAAVGTSFVISRSISNPITKLRNTVIEIGKGDLSKRAQVKSKDEVGELATSFNQMADEIQKRNEQLGITNEELEASNEELRATEEELRAGNEELEATNVELKEAQERLVRSEKLAAIGQLAGGVGHELRNPLGAIKNAIYYIRGKVARSELASTEPRVMEFLNIVDEEINSSTKIISDLLTFSRVGKPAVSPARIENVIDSAVAHTTIPANIELTKNVPADLSELQIDPDQIRQVLVNMLTNAVQAMPEGGKLDIAAREKDGFMEVAVADTGSGISQEAMGKLFEPLFTTKAKGIGLGLAVCKSIVERHDGHIDVESSSGKGTSFTIKLPLPGLNPA